MNYKVRVTGYKPVELSEDDVMTVAEAARALGLSMPGVIRAIERGTLTEVIDEEANYHGRRLLLKTEVKRLARERARTAAGGNGILNPRESVPAAQKPGLEEHAADAEEHAADAEKLAMDAKELAADAEGQVVEGKASPWGESTPAAGERSAVLPIMVPRAKDEPDYVGFLVLDENEANGEDEPAKRTATLHFINGSPPGWPETTTLPMRLGDETSGIRRAILQFYEQLTGRRTPPLNGADTDPNPGEDRE